MKTIKGGVAVILAGGVLAAEPARAQFPQIPNVGGLFGGGAHTPASPATGDAGAFYVDFLHARVETNAAQCLLAKAFDMKDEVTLLETEQASLSSGALDNDGYVKSKELSESVNAKLKAKMEEGAAISGEGRRYYQAAIPHLLVGTLISVRLIGDAKALVDSAKAAMARGSMFEKVRMATVVFSTGRIAADVPAFVGDTTDAYKRVLAYGQANKIPVPKDATDALGTL